MSPILPIVKQLKEVQDIWNLFQTSYKQERDNLI
jgi:hypothetical protein